MNGTEIDPDPGITDLIKRAANAIEESNRNLETLKNLNKAASLALAELVPIPLDKSDTEDGDSSADWGPRCSMEDEEATSKTGNVSEEVDRYSKSQELPSDFGDEFSECARDQNKDWEDGYSLANWGPAFYRKDEDQEAFSKASILSEKVDRYSKNMANMTSLACRESPSDSSDDFPKELTVESYSNFTLEEIFRKFKKLEYEIAATFSTLLPYSKDGLSRGKGANQEDLQLEEEEGKRKPLYKDLKDWSSGYNGEH